jgi:hypothetical protein
LAAADWASLRHAVLAWSTAVTARELAAQFGLHRAGNGWRGRCPACGYNGSFVLTDRKHGPIGWCASCQDREAIAAALGRPQAAPTPVPQAKDANDARARVERAEKIWRGAVPLPDTAAAVYLQARGIGHLIGCVNLRFKADCPHPSGTLGHPVRLPALIAAVHDVTAKFIGVHRTFLRRNGSVKAEIEPAKASLGPVRGGAVRLATIEQVLEAGELIIAEGIETAASAGLLLGLPAWSAVSAGNLAKGIVLPTSIRKIVVAADRDAAGYDAARSALFRLKREGREIRVAIPDNDGEDFNNILLGRREKPA